MTRIVQDGKTVFAPHERIERDAALRAITIDAAYILRMENEVGSIEEGKLADVIVVAGNPLQDMRAMKRVHAVIKGGVRYK